jgi:hypothetical protein
MIRRRFLFIFGTYGMDHIIKIRKTEYYEGRMKITQFPWQIQNNYVENKYTE